MPRNIIHRSTIVNEKGIEHKIFHWEFYYMWENQREIMHARARAHTNTHKSSFKRLKVTFFIPLYIIVIEKFKNHFLSFILSPSVCVNYRRKRIKNADDFRERRIQYSRWSHARSEENSLYDHRSSPTTTFRLTGKRCAAGKLLLRAW